MKKVQLARAPYAINLYGTFFNTITMMPVKPTPSELEGLSRNHSSAKCVPYNISTKTQILHLRI